MLSLQEKFNGIILSLGGTLEQAMIVTSQRPLLADYQVNAALSLAKRLKMSPMGLAQQIIDKIDTKEYLFAVMPGFINIKLSNQSLIDNLYFNPSPSNNTQVLIDFSSPNVAKGMHVGHLRSTLIGAALVNMYKFKGYQVTGDNHIGDWGTPMGIVIAKIMNDPEFEWTLSNIESNYISGAAQYKKDIAFKTLVQSLTVKLQSKEESIYNVWKKIVQTTVASLKEDYDHLGIDFDLWQGESFFEPLIPIMIEELKSKGLAISSSGATILNLSASSPPLILEKSSGGFLYHTTDLACIKYRSDLYSKILYVVDKRQDLHFKQVFSAAKLAGYNKPEMTHVSFGTINGSDGTPFKTRSGDVLKLSDLISQFKQKALEKIKELNPGFSMEDKQEISTIVAIGALKFAELKHHRESDYIFDINHFMSLDGFTGPYVMYNAVRAKSVLNKSNMAGVSFAHKFNPEVRAILALLGKARLTLDKAVKLNQPHILCEYVYELAQSFSSFYAAVNILKESNSNLKGHYIFLVEQYFNTSKSILGLLGITLPKKM